MKTYVKKGVKLQQKFPLLSRQLESLESHTTGFVMLLHIDQKSEGSPKLVGTTYHLCQGVPSSGDCTDHEKWLDLDRVAADLEISSKSGAVEDLFSRTLHWPTDPRGNHENSTRSS